MKWPWFTAFFVIGALVVTSSFFGCSPNKPSLASGNNSAGGATLYGPCSPEGATHVCAVDLGLQHGVHDCFAGTQSCQNGKWSPCAGERTVVGQFNEGGELVGASYSSATINSGLHTLATPAPSADAGICALNPCDPTCLGWDVDAGGTACAAATWLGGSLAATGIPGATLDKLLLDDQSRTGSSWSSDCDEFSTGSSSTSNLFMQCQLDSQCNTSTDFCNAWLPGQTRPATVASGIDLTVGVACSNAGAITVPICNRGNAPVAAGATIQVTEWSNTAKFPIQFDQPIGGGTANCTPPTLGGGGKPAGGTCVSTTGGCPTVASLTALTGAAPLATCSITLPTSLDPGTCVAVDNATHCGGGLTGNGMLYVNSDGAVAESNLIKSTHPWPGCSDNYGFAEVSPLPPACSTFSYLSPTCGLTGGTVLAGSGGYNGLPGGFRKNENPCKVSHRTSPSGPDDHNDCSYDMCCAASGTNCVPWLGAPATGTCTACAAGGGVDFTVAVGCQDPAAAVHFPVCNRGSVAATSGTLRLGIDTGPPGGEHSCGPRGNSGSGLCTIDLTTKPIAAGQCIDVNVTTPAAGITCTGVNTSGNRNVFINEGTALAECDDCNNWAAYNGQSCSGYGGLPPPATQDFVYTAVCPVQTRPQWKNLTYVAVTPAGSDVLFQVQTADFDDGGIAPGLPVVPIDVADPPLAGWPQTCLIGGPAPCPVNLFTALGGPPLATNPNLYLTITLTSTSAVAVLKSWQISYDCVASE